MPLIRRKATSRSTDGVNALVVQGAGSRVEDGVQQLDISGSAKDDQPADIKDVNDLRVVYSTDEDLAFLQAMGELHGKLSALNREIAEEYIGNSDNPDEDALMHHIELLEDEYVGFQKQHKTKFSTHEPHSEILSAFMKEGYKNRNALVQGVFDSVVALVDDGKGKKRDKKSKKDKKKQKRIRDVTAEE